MAIRDTLLKMVEPVLPGEWVQQVFVAQGGPQPWLLVGSSLLVIALGAGVGAVIGGASGALLGMFVVAALALVGLHRWFIKRRIIAVTNAAVVVVAANWSGVKPTGVVVRLPRQTVIDPPQGNRHPITLGGEKMWVSPRFRDEIAAANAGAAARAS
jgi:hypothetical protein